LQARWRIIALPCKLWRVDALNEVMLTCIILHNMIIEDEWDENGGEMNDYLVEDGFQVDELFYDANSVSLVTMATVRNQYMNEVEHYRLRHDLVEHLWDFHGNNLHNN